MSIECCKLKPNLDAFGKLPVNTNATFWVLPKPVGPHDCVLGFVNRLVCVQRIEGTNKFGLNRDMYDCPVWIPGLQFDTPEEAALYCYVLEAAQAGGS